MLEKTGMIELTAQELDAVKRTGTVPSRIESGWNLTTQDLQTLVKTGEYRLIEENQYDHSNIS